MKSLYGGSGYLNILRNFLWLPVAQSSHKRMRVQLFEHILNLSLRWHLQRKTGEVLRVVDRGVSSVNVILSEVKKQRPLLECRPIIIINNVLNVMKMQSVRDHTVFNTMRQCRTVPSCHNDIWLCIRFVYFHRPDAHSSANT